MGDILVMPTVGELIFEMGPEPNKNWANKVSNTPYSMSKRKSNN